MQFPQYPQVFIPVLPNGWKPRLFHQEIFRFEMGLGVFHELFERLYEHWLVGIDQTIDQLDELSMGFIHRRDTELKPGFRWIDMQRH